MQSGPSTPRDMEQELDMGTGPYSTSPSAAAATSSQTSRTTFQPPSILAPPAQSHHGMPGSVLDKFNAWAHRSKNSTSADDSYLGGVRMAPSASDAGAVFNYPQTHNGAISPGRFAETSSTLPKLGRHKVSKEDQLRDQIASIQASYTKERERTKHLEEYIAKLQEKHEKNISYHLQRQNQELEEKHRQAMQQLLMQLQQAEGNVQSQKTQLEKMSQIIMQLNKRGLPYPKDDSYFTREIEAVIGGLRSWARSVGRGQSFPPLTEDDFSKLDPYIQKHLKENFPRLPELLASQKQGTKLRTRCLEAILCGELQQYLLGEPIIGCTQDTETYLTALFSGFHCSDEEVHFWRALTIHLMTKNNRDFEHQMEKGVDRTTEQIWNQIALLGGAGRATQSALREVVFLTAKLGLEIAQLPYKMAYLTLVPGYQFHAGAMEDVEGDMDAEMLELERAQVVIVLSKPLVKKEFDSSGRLRDSQTIIAKGRVACNY